MSSSKTPIDPNFNKDTGKYKSGNEGRLHSQMKHWGYAWRKVAQDKADQRKGDYPDGS